MAVMRLVGIAAALVALLPALAGCERKARTDEPNHYSVGGVQFDYPANWKVTEDTELGAIRHIVVGTPGNALAIIQVYPAAEASDIRTFAEQFAAATKESVPLGEVTPSTFGEVVQSDGYEVLGETFSITVLGQRVPHSRTYRRKAFGDAVAFIITQVSDEDRADVMAGFEQLSQSFSFRQP